jgi:hypothetical protein
MRSCLIGLLHPLILLEEPENGETGLAPHLSLQLLHLRLDYQVNRFMGCDCHIELFFRVLKQGCQIEQLRLQTKPRLVNAIAVYLIVAWRIHTLTMLSRAYPEVSCEVVFEPQEWQTIYSGFQLCASSAGSAGVSPANKPLRKAAKMATLPGLTHVKTAVYDAVSPSPTTGVTSTAGDSTLPGPTWWFLSAHGRWRAWGPDYLARLSTPPRLPLCPGNAPCTHCFLDVYNAEVLGVR